MVEMITFVMQLEKIFLIQKLESFENINKSQLLEIAQWVYKNYDSRNKMNKQIKEIPWVKTRDTKRGRIKTHALP